MLEKGFQKLPKNMFTRDKWLPSVPVSFIGRQLWVVHGHLFKQLPPCTSTFKLYFFPWDDPHGEWSMFPYYADLISLH